MDLQMVLKLVHLNTWEGVEWKLVPSADLLPTYSPKPPYTPAHIYTFATWIFCLVVLHDKSVLAPTSIRKRSKMETCRPIAELPSCQNWSKIKVSKSHKSKENGPKIDVWRKMSRDCLADRKNSIESPPWGSPLGGQVGPKLGPMAAKMGFEALNNRS